MVVQNQKNNHGKFLKMNILTNLYNWIRGCPEGGLNGSEASSQPQRRGQGGSHEREKMEAKRTRFLRRPNA